MTRHGLPSLQCEDRGTGHHRSKGHLLWMADSAGLAHELVDGGQGLWLSLQGGQATADGSGQRGAVLSPCSPRVGPTPDSAHSPSLLAPLGPGSPLEWGGKEKCLDPAAAQRPRSPQRAEDPPLLLQVVETAGHPGLPWLPGPTQPAGPGLLPL